MAQIVLHRYYNDVVLKLDTEHIASMQRFSADNDARWRHPNPQPYTAIKLLDDCKTSEGVSTAYVKETPPEIRALAQK